MEPHVPSSRDCGVLHRWARGLEASATGGISLAAPQGSQVGAAGTLLAAEFLQRNKGVGGTLTIQWSVTQVGFKLTWLYPCKPEPSYSFRHA